MTDEFWDAANAAAIDGEPVTIDGEPVMVDGEPVMREEAEDDPCELVGLEPITNRAFRNGNVMFVRSAQKVGKFYMVTEEGCSCAGFSYRHTCNHVTHLEKAGYLKHDSANGMGFTLVGDPENGNGIHRAEQVTTGIRHSLANSPSEVEARDAQIRRLQDLSRAQTRLISAQRRLVTALRMNDDMAVARRMKMVQVADDMVDQASAALERGDLVELAE